MQPKSVKCFQCYSIGKPYLVVASSVKAIIPLTAYYAYTNLDWHLGAIHWENQDVQVINLACEALTESSVPHSHMMIIQCIAEQAPAYIAIMIAQMARPINITATDLELRQARIDHLYPVKGDNVIGDIVDIRKLSNLLREHELIES